MSLIPKKIKLSDDVAKLIDNSSSINHMMNEAVLQMSRDMNAKKEAIIKQRTKELTGIEIDFKKEAQRRFKRFCTVNSGNRQTIYFNDGSEVGIRIVTFERTETPFNPENFSIGYKETYY